jgi:hypothetical protein
MAIIIKEPHLLQHDTIKAKLKPVEASLKSKNINLHWINEKEAHLNGFVSGKLKLEQQHVELSIESNMVIKLYGEKKLEQLIRDELKKNLV